MAFEDEQEVPISKYGITYTAAEQTFWQAWCDYWSRPKDCDEKTIAANLSSYCRFREWLNNTHPPISMALLEACMEEMSKMDSYSTYPPKFKKLINFYCLKCKRSQAVAVEKNTPPGENCVLCGGSGLVHVTSIREPGRKPRPLPAPRVVDPLSGFAHRPVPCKCSKGMHWNTKVYKYPDDVMNILFGIRTTIVEHMKLVADSCSMSGINSAAPLPLAPAPVRPVKSMPVAQKHMAMKQPIRNALGRVVRAPWQEEYQDVANERQMTREQVTTAAAVSDSLLSHDPRQAVDEWKRSLPAETDDNW